MTLPQAERSLRLSPKQLVETLVSEERWRQVLSSLVVCFFARGIYQPETVTKALEVAGFDLSGDDLAALGETIHREKYRFKLREGSNDGRWRVQSG